MRAATTFQFGWVEGGLQVAEDSNVIGQMWPYFLPQSDRFKTCHLIAVIVANVEWLKHKMVER
jgi:hypothetical protein